MNLSVISPQFNGSSLALHLFSTFWTAFRQIPCLGAAMVLFETFHIKEKLSKDGGCFWGKLPCMKIIPIASSGLLLLRMIPLASIVIEIYLNKQHPAPRSFASGSQDAPSTDYLSAKKEWLTTNLNLASFDFPNIVNPNEWQPFIEKWKEYDTKQQVAIASSQALIVNDYDWALADDEERLLDKISQELPSEQTVVWKKSPQSIAHRKAEPFNRSSEEAYNLLARALENCAVMDRWQEEPDRATQFHAAFKLGQRQDAHQGAKALRDLLGELNDRVERKDTSGSHALAQDITGYFDASCLSGSLDACFALATRRYGSLEERIFHELSQAVVHEITGHYRTSRCISEYASIPNKVAHWAIIKLARKFKADFPGLTLAEQDSDKNTSTSLDELETISKFVETIDQESFDKLLNQAYQKALKKLAYQINTGEFRPSQQPLLIWLNDAVTKTSIIDLCRAKKYKAHWYDWRQAEAPLTGNENPWSCMTQNQLKGMSFFTSVQELAFLCEQLGLVKSPPK